MGVLDKIKSLVQKVTHEPTQTERAQITQTGRVLSDHPVNKLTPTGLKSLLEDAENGDITAQCELFMDIEEMDASIAANIQTRKRGALTFGYQIIAPLNATPAEEKLTEAVSELFRQFGNLEDLIVDCLSLIHI